MGRFIDLSGQKFGRLTVIERAGSTKRGAAKWLCLCECGCEAVIIGDELRKGNTKSCGCYAREVATRTIQKIAGKNKTHEKTGTLIYKEWSQMKRRCENPNDINYKNYGGRGITVCDRWKNSFEAFYEDVSKLPHFGEKGFTLDRIDNNGNYSPENVRWANGNTQANNRRGNRLFTYLGKTQTISQWASEYGIPYKKVWKRLTLLHWEIERALSTP